MLFVVSHSHRCIIGAGFVYRAVVTNLAESGIHVKPNIMKAYMKRVFRFSLRVPMISKDAS